MPNTNYGKSKLTDIDLSDNDHSNSVFDAVEFLRVDLSNCRMDNCSFKRAVLEDVNFSECWVEEGEELAVLLKAARKVINCTMPDGSILNPPAKKEEAPDDKEQKEEAPAKKGK